MGKRNAQVQVCNACGYTLSTGHETWCAASHPKKWSSSVVASTGPAWKPQKFYEGTQKNIAELTELFRVWMLHEKEFGSQGTGTFNITVSHFLEGRIMKHSDYTVSFVPGRSRELWGNYLSDQHYVRPAWEKAGGIYRQS